MSPLMDRSARFWRLAGVTVATVVVVVTATVLLLNIETNNDPSQSSGRNPPGVVFGDFLPTWVEAAPLLEHGNYVYESRSPDTAGRRLHFHVPQGLVLMIGWEGWRPYEQPGLVLFTSDGRSWLCLSVSSRAECGRGVHPDADGIEELFDTVIATLHDDLPSPTWVEPARLLEHGNYVYASRGRYTEGRLLHFHVPEGLVLMIGWEGWLPNEQPGLVLFTSDGRSWLCLSVSDPVECGRGVHPDADGIAELFDRVNASLRWPW